MAMAVSVDSRYHCYQSFASSILDRVCRSIDEEDRRKLGAKIQSKTDSSEISARRRNSKRLHDIVFVRTRSFDQGINMDNLPSSSSSSSSTSTSPASGYSSSSSCADASPSSSDYTPASRAKRSLPTSPRRTGGYPVLREALWSGIEVTPRQRRLPDEKSAAAKSKSNGSEKSSGNLNKSRRFLSSLFGLRKSTRKESGKEEAPAAGMKRVASGMPCLGDRSNSNRVVGKDGRVIFSLADIKVQL